MFIDERSMDAPIADVVGWLELELEPPDGLVDAEPGDEDDEQSPFCDGY
jgi:hypothetical protein